MGTLVSVTFVPVGQSPVSSASPRLPAAGPEQSADWPLPAVVLTLPSPGSRLECHPLLSRAVWLIEEVWGGLESWELGEMS